MVRSHGRRGFVSPTNGMVSEMALVSLTTAKAANLLWKFFDRAHGLICSVAGLLALASLWVHKTPLQLLHQWGVPVQSVAVYASAPGWHRGLAIGGATIAILAMVGLISAGRESAWMFAHRDHYGPKGFKRFQKDSQLLSERDIHNLSWMWLAVLLLTQTAVLTADRMWLFVFAVCLLRAIAESTERDDSWYDRRETFFLRLVGLIPFGFLALVKLPIRLWGLFSYPLSYRRPDDLIPLPADEEDGEDVEGAA